MSLLSDSIIAGIAAVPATLAAVLSYKGNVKAKDAVDLAHQNKARLHDLGNGLMDEKIRAAIREVMLEQPSVVTEANLADMLSKFLDQHLD